MAHERQRRAAGKMKPRIWPILLASGLGLALLVSLGVWQVQRLAWKNALIANFDNTKVTLVGHFLDKPPLRLLSTSDGGPAWRILQDFETDQGKVLLVSRGKIEQTATLPANIVGTVTLVGYMQTHNKGRGFFDVDNQPAQNMWYYWDVPAMLGQPSTGEVLQLAPASRGTEGLIVEPPKSELSNNHLGYAITWFGLAAALLVMTAIFVSRQRKAS
jgi:surfeit locus 1 family protein